ncbi:MAG: GIY-YIG nuclease family protein [Deltaproteobacteria bacterium]|nr:GIY-YIG nuclease family protein [Deltaproteobacteria bacterium]
MKVYLAGTDGGVPWREELVTPNALDNPTYRPYDDPSIDEPLLWKLKPNAILDVIDYTGPYWPTDEVVNDEGDWIRRKKAIDESDFVFVWIDNDDYHGIYGKSLLGYLATEVVYARCAEKLCWFSSNSKEVLTNHDIWFIRQPSDFFPMLYHVSASPLEAFIQSLEKMAPFFSFDIQFELKKLAKKKELLWHKGLDKLGYIYLIKEFHSGTYKIGRTVNVSKRANLFEVKLPFKIKLIHHFPASDMYEAESILHKKYKELRTNGEWFSLDQDDVNEIIGITSYQDVSFHYE